MCIIVCVCVCTFVETVLVFSNLLECERNNVTSRKNDSSNNNNDGGGKKTIIVHKSLCYGSISSEVQNNVYSSVCEGGGAIKLNAWHLGHDESHNTLLPWTT